MAAPSDFRYLVVPHTHWDREWYLPFETFRLRLGAVVDGVLDTLERDPSFTSFTLDGQAIVLEDYAEVRPDNEGRLRALLAAGRLEAGPSYVLPDEILVGDESIVRNLLLGRRVCRRFGVRRRRNAALRRRAAAGEHAAGLLARDNTSPRTTVRPKQKPSARSQRGTALSRRRSSFKSERVRRTRELAVGD